VRWNSVCQTKENGGLGVRDVRVLNVSLLAKWKWRLLDGEMALWKEVLVEKYGPQVTAMVDGELCTHWRNASSWWKDVVSLENFGVQGWFNSELIRVVGNGLNTSFWNVKWKGDRTFRSKYPRLFSISNQKEGLVGELGVVVGSLSKWHFEWRREFFDWEEQLWGNLLGDLEDMRWSQAEDRWRWGLEVSGLFSVKSSYDKLEGVVVREDVWSVEEKGVLAKLWKSPAPSKVVAFSWKLLYDRIPTRVNLSVRNVLPMDVPRVCTLYERVDDPSIHLFLHCEVAGRVWRDIMGLVGEVYCCAAEFICLMGMLEQW